jgi:hypothetical protein
MESKGLPSNHSNDNRENRAKRKEVNKLNNTPEASIKFLPFKFFFSMNIPFTFKN